MRLAVKTSLVSAAALIAVTLVLGWVYERRFRGFEEELTRRTAQLLGRELAAALSEPSLSRILRGDAPTRTHLRKMIAGVTQGSQVVQSVTVVNARGVVVASDVLEVGTRTTTPAELFGDERETLRQGGEPDEPSHSIVVPLERRGHLAGYLRLRLSGPRIARAFGALRGDFALAGGIALLGVIAIGALVQLELWRRGRSLAHAIEALADGRSGDPSAAGSEFAQVFETAGRVARELADARSARARAHRQLGTLTGCLDVGILVLGPTGTLEFASPRAGELLGASSPDALAERWIDQRASLATALAAARADADDGPAQVDWRPAGADGAAARTLRLESYPLAEDADEGHLVLLKDGALLSALETDLRLATQVRSFAHLYRAVAHELRAPLSALSTSLERLETSLESEPGERADVRQRRRDSVAVARDELRRLDASLYVMLAETAPPSSGTERIDLRVLLLDLERLLAPQAARQKVQIDVQIPDAEVAVRARRDHLKQAVLNVAINALEAMPDGGWLRLDVSADGGPAVLGVRDSGPGIPLDRIGRIFEMHYSTKESGTGIGLYVARSVVEALGGTLRAESVPEHGSRFELRLPLAPEDETA